MSLYNFNNLIAIVEELQQKQIELEQKLDDMFPVGHILYTTNSANPSTYGYPGTWQQYAQGKTIVGRDSSDKDFNSVGTTGGNKTRTVTVNVSHKHRLDYGTAYIRYAFIGGQGASIFASTADLTSAPEYYEARQLMGASIENPHANPVNYATPVQGETNSTNISGTTTVNTLQPYIITYIWRRTA